LGSRADSREIVFREEPTRVRVETTTSRAAGNSVCLMDEETMGNPRRKEPKMNGETRQLLEQLYAAVKG